MRASSPLAGGLDFNPRTPCGVRPARPTRDTHTAAISIHAPLAGCDFVRAYVSPRREISIHAPLAGCDPRRKPWQSRARHFNPRTPCGVRRAIIILHSAPLVISIHAPLAGCDPPPSASILRAVNFNPRTPCGVRRTQPWQNRSICYDFNPRTPCGVRQNVPAKPKQAATFQSTHPLRGATANEK